MSQDAFDPYYKWFGIPPAEQPPDHYRLLGINRFEADPDVIDHAADGRMAQLRTFQSGPNAHWSQKLLSKVAIARTCLLNPESRREYDVWLSRNPPIGVRPIATAAPAAMPPSTAATAAPSPVEPRAEQPPPVPPGAISIPVAVTQPPRRPAQPQPSHLPQVLKIVGGGLLGIVLGYFIVRWMMGIDMLQVARSPAPPAVAVKPSTPANTRSPKASKGSPNTIPPQNQPSPAPAETKPSSDAAPPNAASAPLPTVQPQVSETPTVSPPAAAIPTPASPEPPQPLVLTVQPPEASSSSSATPASKLEPQPATPRLYSADGQRVDDPNSTDVHTIEGWKDLTQTALSKEYHLKASHALLKIAETRERNPFNLSESEVQELRKTALELLSSRVKKGRDEATDIAIRQNALLTLKYVGDASCNSELLEWLVHESPVLRKAAMQALEVHADKTCVSKLKSALKRRNQYAIDLPGDTQFMMRAGIQILAKIGTPDARDALTELLALAKVPEAKEQVRQAIDQIDAAKKK